jgi:hypothetical protein
VPFRKERRMKFTEATKFYRKSGGAKWKDLLLKVPPFCLTQFGKVRLKQISPGARLIHCGTHVQPLVQQKQFKSHSVGLL